jgi:hypothetical protein
MLALNDTVSETQKSHHDFKTAVKGTKAPHSILDSLVIIDVEYYGFDNKLHTGQIIVNVDVKSDVIEVFKIMKDDKFPINSIIPIVDFDWDDGKSMQANNSSGFNFRYIAGTKRMSHHATGRAIDINPMLNPVIYNDGKISPKGASYNPDKPGTFSNSTRAVKFLKSKGWRWGGDWTSFKDYHHFDKP